MTLGNARSATQLKRGRDCRRDQRLLYWGALRAFFRPYFLRSTARGSRVRKPAFFRAGRSPGVTMINALAIASRSAPAWPDGPPPSRWAKMSKASSRSTMTSGALEERWGPFFGKVSPRGGAVKFELAGAGPQPHPNHGLLAAPDGLDR